MLWPDSTGESQDKLRALTLMSCSFANSCQLCNIIETKYLVFPLLISTGTPSVHTREIKNLFFCFSAGLPDEIIKVAPNIKPVIEIQQNGSNFVVTSKTPKQSVTNSFTLGKEADITTMDGKKMKVTYQYFRNSSSHNSTMHHSLTSSSNWHVKWCQQASGAASEARDMVLQSRVWRNPQEPLGKIKYLY